MDQIRRGVFYGQGTIRGHRYLIAYTSTLERFCVGGKPKVLILYPGVSHERAVRWFQQQLDRVDPLPTLRLVDGGARPVTPTADPYAHPYRPPRESDRLFPHRPMRTDDAVTHALRLAKQSARRIPYFRDRLPTD